jgi:hypothetical protein
MSSRPAQVAAPAPSMAEVQGATPPAWLERSRWRLFLDALGGWRQNLDKLVQLAQLVFAFFRPALVRARLARLQALGHVEQAPTLPQLLVAARDQMIVSATEETRIFYRSQRIPWIFHNLRRLVSGPATMLDPVGLFSPRDTIVHHVLQTFHRHPLYDLVLLRAHPDGVDELARQVDQIQRGTHPHQRALTSLIEDGSYHARLPSEIATFRADPFAPARPIPDGLLPDRYMMAAMDQFKDLRGYTRYAARLDAGWGAALGAWLAVAFDETLGGLLRIKLGPRRVRTEALDPEIAQRHLRAS